MTNVPPPVFSVVIVSYNSLPDLQRCIPSIQQQNVLFPYEIIVVDNHRQDGVAAWVREHWPDVLLIENSVNNGYAGGNNLGLQHCSGQWVLFLNPDTVVHTGTLQRLMQTAQTYPEAFINAKLLNPDGTINACGNQMQYTGITTCRGLNEPAAAYTGVAPIPLLSGAAFVAPTAAVRELGGFDESYFMYFEDADLSLRARLCGIDLLCDQDAAITHYYRLGMTPTKFYYLERNRLTTLLKVLSQRTWNRLLPALLLTEILMWGFALRGLTYLRSRVRTYAWLWQNRRAVRQQHEAIQQTRRRPDEQLWAGATVAIPFEQLVNGPLGAFIKAVLWPVYRLLKPRAFKTTD